VYAHSSMNTLKSDMSEFCVGVPAAFAQIFMDTNDWVTRLNLVQPTFQKVQEIPPGGHLRYSPAIAETGKGFAAVWREWRYLSGYNVVELYTMVVDQDGIMQGAIHPLTDLSGMHFSSSDEDQTIAVAPNGRIGIVWNRYLNDSSDLMNVNIYFAVLEPSGNLVSGPTNITNNNIYGDWDGINVPFYYDPAITATDDNHFVLSWEREVITAGGDISDIYYSIRDTDNNQVKGITNFTNDTAGSATDYSRPAVTRLNGDRFLLAFVTEEDINFAVMDSEGNPVKSQTSSGIIGFQLDATELTTGDIMMAGSAWSGRYTNIYYVLLDGVSYDVTVGPVILANELDNMGVRDVAVAAGQNGYTSMMAYDYNADIHRAYYALIDKEGNTIFPPSMVYSSPGYLSISENAGYSITSYLRTLHWYMPVITN
jgi:hypothetical protein